MGIIVVEGSNGVGKSTIINNLEEKYEVVVKKSIPEWFRKYIEYARSLEPNLQKQMYLIGHDANFHESKDKKNYIFDRFYYSTIIRLNYQLGKTVNETVREIFEINLVPDYIFYVTANEYIVRKRLLERNGFKIDKNFFEYENRVYKQMLELCGTISVVDNSCNIGDAISKVDEIVAEKKLMLRRIK